MLWENGEPLIFAVVRDKSGRVNLVVTMEQMRELLALRAWKRETEGRLAHLEEALRGRTEPYAGA